MPDAQCRSRTPTRAQLLCVVKQGHHLPVEHQPGYYHGFRTCVHQQGRAFGLTTETPLATPNRFVSHTEHTIGKNVDTSVCNIIISRCVSLRAWAHSIFVAHSYSRHRCCFRVHRLARCFSFSGSPHGLMPHHSELHSVRYTGIPSRLKTAL